MSIRLQALCGWALRALVFGALLSHSAAAQAADANSALVIGTGGKSGVYDPVGTAICSLVNRTARQHGLSCRADSSGGSVDNIERLRSGAANFGIVQSDILYYAVNGFGPFKAAGPDKSLRGVVTLHTETFTVLARADADIRDLDDLPGKNINIGNPGSGQHTFFELLMRVKGWTPETFAELQEHTADEQVDILCSGHVDAIVYVVGHPNDAIKSAATSCPTNLVEIRGPAVSKLIETFPYFVPSKIRGRTYSGTPTTVHSFGVAAVLVTTSAMPDDAVHTLTRLLFGGFTDLKFSHSALSAVTPQGMAVRSAAPVHPGAKHYIEQSTDLYKLMEVKPARR